MTDPLELVLALCVLAAIIGLGAVITIGNERVRQSTLRVQQVAHEYALADLAMRREQVRQSLGFATRDECLRALEQIALDASKERLELANLNIVDGSAPALVAVGRDGATCVFTPVEEAFLKAHPDFRRRVVKTHAISGLVSSPFVIQELEAVAHSLGITSLPRTEEWSLLILSANDYSLLPKRGLVRRLRPKGS